MSWKTTRNLEKKKNLSVFLLFNVQSQKRSGKEIQITHQTEKVENDFLQRAVNEKTK